MTKLLNIILFISVAITSLTFINNAFEHKAIKDNNQLENYLSLIAICKNEGPYLQEWIEYHKIVGVEKFYIYDNGSEDNTKEILEPYIRDGTVIYKYYPGIDKQLEAYNNAINYCKEKTRWCACIDLDEFIVPVQKGNLREILSDYEEFSGLAVNWVVYGDSGNKKKTEGLVIERFKHHSFYNWRINKHIKSIVNPRAVSSADIHFCKYLFGYSVDENKRPQFGPFNNPPYQNIIRINHYINKSFEEFLAKRKRGWMFPLEHPINLFHLYNKNEVKDDYIMDKYIPLIKKAIDTRGKIPCKTPIFIFPDISIIILIQNKEVWLREKMQNLINNIGDKSEIICIDNASTDSSRVLIEEFYRNNMGKFHPIWLSEKLGSEQAIEKGKNESIGKYVVSFDIDNNKQNSKCGIIPSNVQKQISAILNMQ